MTGPMFKDELRDHLMVTMRPQTLPADPAKARSSQVVQAQVLHPADISSQDLALWANMRESNPAFESPLVSPEFAMAAGTWRHDSRVAILYHKGEAAGFFPFQARPGGLARPIGAPFSDLHALITAGPVPFDAQEALRAIGIKKFRFSGLIDPYELFRNARATPVRGSLLRVGADPAPVLDLLLRRSPKRFKQYRRLERKLEREAGPIALHVGDPDFEAFQSVMNWKRSQFAKNGLHDVLAPEWVRSMMLDLASMRDGQVQGCLITLRAGGKLVAAEFGMRDRGVFHPWIAAYDPAMAVYSPGMLLMLRLIEAMPRENLHTYDLGPSIESYKPYFQTDVRLVSQGAVTAYGEPRGPFVDILQDERLRTTAARIINRIDHVASVELSALGRIRGIITAFRAMRTRLDAGNIQDEAKD